MTRHIFIKAIKVFLIVFCFFIQYSCKNSNAIEVEVIYDSGKAIAVSYTSKLVSEDAKIFLNSNNETPVLGELRSNNNRYFFEPVIPFSAGETYIISDGNNEIIEFTINQKTNIEAPELVAIYPSTDTVPENLLKMYFKFSKPMQEVGNALDYISITNEATDEEVDVFLELNTELWNNEHTLLTLWLDPGRIKTDLIPNKELGLPIIKGNTYTLKVDQTWKDAYGNTLDKAYEKTFRVTDRDAKKPNVNSWSVFTTSESLIIHFNEPMDGILASEVFNVKNEADTYITGDFELTDNESVLKFYPKVPFKKGNYTIEVESKFEDLAGNNLNHAFDKDLSQSDDEKETETKSLQFTIN